MLEVKARCLWCSYYEHIRFGGPILWKLLHDLYHVFFDKSSVCKTLKTGLVLPLFKGKGATANNNDNYHGITLFPTICKIYEKIILNRLEKFASQGGYFLEIQFAVLRHLLRHLKPLTICWKGVARCLVVSLTSEKFLIRFGSMG